VSGSEKKEKNVGIPRDRNSFLVLETSWIVHVTEIISCCALTFSLLAFMDSPVSLSSPAFKEESLGSKIELLRTTRQIADIRDVFHLRADPLFEFIETLSFTDVYYNK
jgi:hypothetical protein